MEKEKVKITCYGKAEYWDDREKAKMFYLECMMGSEGSEQQRYTQIYLQLCEGQMECSDEEEW